MQENDITKQLFAKTLELEKQLRTASKASGPLDKTAFQLRDALRESYEKLVFLDYEFATSKDVEINLWKNVFYKVIEEFRKRLRKSTSKSQESQQSQNTDRTGSAFKAFLETSSQFYNNFIAKLQSTFNLKLDKPVPEDISDTNSTLYKQYLSCHRSLTYLGDLARYIRDVNPKSRDWMASANYYKRALKLMPSWGNPHNQLAVLNTYCDDDFNAVYHYFRSLAVTHPFLTARDNINVLLEKNKAKVEGSQSSSQSSGRGGKLQKEFIEDADIAPEVRSFLSKFVRLHGILFTKNNLESWPELETKALSEYEQLLRKDLINEQVLLKIFVINIFTFNNINVVPDGITPSYIEIGQRTELQKYSLSLALETYLIAMRVITKANQKLPKLLKPLSIFSDWMKYNCLYLKKSEFSEAKWMALRETTASFLNYILGILANNMAEDISASMKRPLVEELELQGFLPLKESFQLVDFQAAAMLDNNPMNIDDRVLGILKRMTKIKAFGLILANYQVPDTDEKIVYYNTALGKFSLRSVDDDQINTQVDQAVNKLSQLKANQPLMDAEEIQSTPISSLPKSGVQFLNSPMLANGNFPFGSSNNNSMLHIDASNLSMEPVPQMDQEDEEVILFKPSSSNNVKTDVASPSKARPEPIGSEIRSSPGSQPNNMPPLVTVANNTSVNRGPTGWDMFASQAQPQQQQPFNSNGMPNGAPLSTQVMGGQMYTPFGNYGNQMGAPTPSSFSSQGSQSMGAPTPQPFGGFFGSSTDYNNPFGGAATKGNPLNAPVQPSYGVSPAPNNNSNNVPSVFNSIWSSEPADKKSPRYTAMPHVAVNAPPGFSTVNGESVIDNPFKRGNNTPQMPSPQLIQMAVNIPGFTQLPLLQQQQILSQLQAHSMQSKPFS